MKKILRWGVAGLILLLPFLFILLPYDYFDHGTTLCPSKAFLDITCPGCGLTRGLARIFHLKFAEAWNYNVLSLPVSIGLVMLWIHVFGRAIGKKYLWFLRKLY